MAKRPDALESLKMALEMARRIPKGRSVTATELQQQLADAGFERDMRTIQRQLETLSEYFDLERDETSKPYRYSWKERAKGLSLPGLSAQESLLLTLAEQHLRNLLPARLLKSMNGFFAQAREQMGDAKVPSREKAWLKKVRVASTSQPLLPPKVHPKVFEEVSNALYADLWLDLDYTNAAGKSARHRVMPLGLAQQGARMYLVCRFDGYDNERSLALHRMQSAQATAFGFDRPREFDLEQYDNDGRFGYGDGEYIHLKFRIEKTAGYHLLESPLSEDQHVRAVGDEYQISATVVDTDMLDWWLRGFGESVRLISKKKVKP
jgi:predicted DNA-binding transcriptional regulator YafY